MESRVIRYIGCNHSDVILYTAYIASKLSKDVLIVDLSDEKAMKTAFPVLEGIDCETDIINFRQVSYTCCFCPESFEVYDLILINYGYQVENFERCKDDLCFLISSQLPHEHLRVAECVKHIDIRNANIIIRNILDERKLPETIKLWKLSNMDSEYKLRTIPFDMSDLYSTLFYETRKYLRLTKISNSMKKYLLVHLKEILNDVSDKRIKKAFMNASKR